MTIVGRTCLRLSTIVALMLLLVIWNEEQSRAQNIERSYSLPDVIGLAIDHNPRPAGAIGAIDIQQGLVIQAGAYPNPSIAGRGGRGSLRDAGVLGPGVFSEAPPNTAAEYNAQVSQPFEWPPKREARKNAAQAGLEGAIVGYDETLLHLRADVKLAFWTLLSAQRSLQLAKENLAIIEDIRQTVDRRVELGEAPRFEAIKAEVEVLKAEQRVTREENNVEVSRVVLDSLTAGSLGPRYSIEGEFERIPAALERTKLVEDALQQHPTLRRLRKVIEESGRTVDFERQARVPNLTVQGGYWREIGREAVQGGLSLPFPIWYQRQGEIASALGTLRREEANLLRVRYDFIRQVNQHFRDATTAGRLVVVFEQGLLRKTQVALHMAQFSFKRGESSLLQVLDAQRVHREIMLDYWQARHDLSIATTQLERFVGQSLYVR
ncbi:MAG: putative Heavy metal efflux system, outer membrane lipoprotein [Candidatus Nitrospira kreftii]|uniref:Putative Heavy metal efflux system, outer membrane lipoprotein n=1 Tax=Candidatus Nitrospira kreftii TaxID=2652173 RepID=A0A7S8IZP4_9BACT|nr:MAG: putative Heavy metal efflux system, outer membrane lipoprotein [Candidatus Nitrospira kreftii]